MIDAKFNIVKAERAKDITHKEHPKKLYIDYMRALNDKIITCSEERGWTSMLHIAPSDIIADKVYKELEEAGYKVELHGEGQGIEVSWD